jgi:hypothetical protein
VRSLTEAIDEVDRELAVRRRIFPKWVEDGKLSQTEAIDRLERLTASSTYLKRFRDLKPGEAPIASLHQPSLPSQEQAVQ